MIYISALPTSMGITLGSDGECGSHAGRSLHCSFHSTKIITARIFLRILDAV